MATGNPKLHFDLSSLISLGNPFAWQVTLSLYLWAFLSQKLCWKKTFQGPPTPYGYVPEYASNGFEYYVITTLLFSIYLYFYPNFASDVYDNFGAVIQVFNVTALALCLYLLFKGKYFPETGNDPLQNFQDRPLPYIFYRGVELHPRIMGVDVKQVKRVLYYKDISESFYLPTYLVDKLSCWNDFLGTTGDTVLSLGHPTQWISFGSYSSCFANQHLPSQRILLGDWVLWNHRCNHG